MRPVSLIAGAAVLLYLLARSVPAPKAPGPTQRKRMSIKEAKKEQERGKRRRELRKQS